MQTVEGNKVPFTRREIARAEQARDLFVRMARPAIKDFEKMVREGRILNCPVTVADIRRAEEIFGAEIGVVRGRTVRESPRVVNVEKRSENTGLQLSPTDCSMFCACRYLQEALVSIVQMRLLRPPM